MDEICPRTENCRQYMERGPQPVLPEIDDSLNYEKVYIISVNTD